MKDHSYYLQHILFFFIMFQMKRTNCLLHTENINKHDDEKLNPVLLLWGGGVNVFYTEHI